MSTSDKLSSRKQSASDASVRVDLGSKKYEIGRKLCAIVADAKNWEEVAERAAALFHPSGSGAEIWSENVGPATFPADRLIAIGAFRYALGRMTSMPSHVVGWLIAHEAKLSAADRALIVREIDEAADQRRLGMDCDVVTWSRLRDALALDPNGVGA